MTSPPFIFYNVKPSHITKIIKLKNLNLPFSAWLLEPIHYISYHILQKSSAPPAAWSPQSIGCWSIIIHIFSGHFLSANETAALGFIIKFMGCFHIIIFAYLKPFLLFITALVVEGFPDFLLDSRCSLFRLGFLSAFVRLRKASFLSCLCLALLL